MPTHLRRAVYESLPHEACADFSGTSLMEFTALMRYSLSGATRAWTTLSRESQMHWVTEDCQKAVCEAPSPWQRHACKYGMATSHVPSSADLPEDVMELRQWLMHERFLDREPQGETADDSGTVKRLQQEPGLPAKRVKLETPAFRNHPCNDARASEHVSGTDVERQITKILGHLYEPFSQGMLNFVQVLRGVCAVCRLWHKDSWPQHVGVLTADDEERASALDLQWSARLLLIVLQTPRHWSLLAVQKLDDGTASAVYYDTLKGRTCWDLAVAALAHLQEKKWLQDVPVPQAAGVPQQPDPWSCGHRVVVIADHILSAMSTLGELLCRFWRSLTLKSRPVRCRKLNEERAAASEAVLNSPPVEEPPCTPPRKRKLLDLDASSGAKSSRKTSPRLPKGARPSRIGRAAKAKADSKKPKQKVQSAKELQREGESLAKQHDIQHAEFQRLHYRANVPPPRGAGLRSWQHWLMTPAVCVPTCVHEFILQRCKMACQMGQMCQCSQPRQCQKTWLWSHALLMMPAVHSQCDWARADRERTSRKASTSI